VIAALYVERDGAYYGLDDVDPWDEERDARLYDGPWPVIAHPPCQRWCALAAMNEVRYGYRVGDDHGTFAAALAAVRKWGGLLEHPANSLAWPAFGLQRPIRGAWSRAMFDDPGWVTSVSQVAYGHVARKRTWLYYVGPEPAPLNWSEPKAQTVVGDLRAAENHKRGLTRISKAQSLGTPPAFRDALIALARSAR
jgi:hypothetical protein